MVIRRMVILSVASGINFCDKRGQSQVRLSYAERSKNRAIMYFLMCLLNQSLRLSDLNQCSKEEPTSAIIPAKKKNIKGTIIVKPSHSKIVSKVSI